MTMLTGPGILPGMLRQPEADGQEHNQVPWAGRCSWSGAAEQGGLRRGGLRRGCDKQECVGRDLPIASPSGRFSGLHVELETSENGHVLKTFVSDGVFSNRRLGSVFLCHG